MGITEVRDGKKVVISRIEGGRKMRQKLIDMGIIPGVPVTIIRQTKGRPLLLSVMGRQLMIGYSMAKKVHVH